MNSQLDPTLIKHIVNAITFVLSLAMICFCVMGTVAFYKVTKGAPKSFGMLFQRSLRMTTVLTIIIAVVALTVMDKLNDSVIAIMSSLAGYVLGGMKENDGENRNSTTGEAEKKG